jgi:hypothetical protein
MGKALWNRPAPAAPGTKVGTAVLEPTVPEEVTAVSHQQLVERGWCAWQCERLGGDTIIVVVGEGVTGYPEGYPVYTLQELRDILPMDDKLLQVAHRAKRELGAQIGGAPKTTEEAT